ncbi:hypothetical protein ACO0LB_17800 [Undibacterium sp. SXout7W]|uniref:hypothetical protein n=1 Tax=Undibacterium sp. SXout7W TaxID=3413049 RepID=UPI003BEFEC5B
MNQTIQLICVSTFFWGGLAFAQVVPVVEGPQHLHNMLSEIKAVGETLHNSNLPVNTNPAHESALAGSEQYQSKILKCRTNQVPVLFSYTFSKTEISTEPAGSGHAIICVKTDFVDTQEMILEALTTIQAGVEKETKIAKILVNIHMIRVLKRS